MSAAPASPAPAAAPNDGSIPLRAVVFGKAGCDKCKVLRRRVEDLVRRTAAGRMEPVYVDVETEPGLVAFCRAEVLNPQRIPALLFERRDEATGRYAPLPRPAGESAPPDGTRLPRILGLQTDYSDEGRGVIPPRAIAAELQQALAAAP